MQEVEPVLLLRFRKSLFNLGHSLFTQTSLGVGKLLGSLFKILPNRGRTYGADCNTFIDGATRRAAVATEARGVFVCCSVAST